MAKDEQTSSKDWEIQEGGEVDDRWVLQDSEQQFNDQWDIEGTDEPISQWQPVEYEKPSRGRLTWVLPTIVTVALLGVLGFSAYKLASPVKQQFEEWFSTLTGRQTPAVPETPLPEGAVAAEASPTAEAVAPVADTPTSQPEPPTQEPPTPVPTATPPVIDQTFGTVTSTYGVNAREQPNTDAPIIRILEQGETFFVYEEQQANGETWLQLFVSDTPLSAGQPVTGVVGYAAAEYFAQAAQPLTRELYNQVMVAGGFTPEPETQETPAEVEQEPAAETPAAETPVAETPAVSTGLPTITPSSPSAPSQPMTLSVTIDAVNGVNVRTLPNLTSDVVALLPDQTVVPAVSRLATNDWVRVDLGDGAQGWVSADFIAAEGDISLLPVTVSGELPQPTPTPTETPAPDVAALAVTAEPPAPYTNELPAGVPGASVVSIEGVNARETPSTDSTVVDIVPQYAALPVVGRSADGEWLLVEMPQGGTAWIFRSTIIPIGDVNSVPVSDATGSAAVQPAAQATPQETAPAATAEATPAADAKPAPASAAGTVRQVVSQIFGVPSQEGETLERVGKGVVLPVIGRTADSQWIQIKSASGTVGWISAASIDVNVDIETLPVTE